MSTERERLDRIVDRLIEDVKDFKDRRWYQSTDLDNMTALDVPGPRDARDPVYREDVMAVCIRAALDAARDKDEFLIVLAEMLITHYGGAINNALDLYGRFIHPTE